MDLTKFEDSLELRVRAKKGGRELRGMNGRGDENHPIMGSAGGEPAPIISFFIGIITIIIALQRLPPVPTNLPLVSSTGRPWPSQGDRGVHRGTGGYKRGSPDPLCQLNAP